MITFIILLLIAILIIILAIATLGVGGVVLFVVLGDVIVCIAIINWLVKHFKNRKR